MTGAERVAAGGWRTLWAKGWVRTLALALVGGVVGYFVGGWLAGTGVLEPYEPAIEAAIARDGWWLLAGWLLAIMLGIVSVMIFAASLKPSWLAKMTRAPDGDDMRAMIACYRVSAIGAGCEGALLVLLLVGGLSPAIGIALGVALAALNGWMLWLAVKTADELWRHVTLEAGALYGALLATIFSIWAVLAHFAAVAPIAPLPLMTILFAAGVVASLVIVGRRGLIE